MFNRKCIILLLIGVFVWGIIGVRPRYGNEADYLEDLDEQKESSAKTDKSIAESSDILCTPFKGKDRTSNKLVEYRIEFLPYSKQKEALEMIVKYMFKENPYSIAFGMCC